MFPRDFYSANCISLFFYNLFRLIACSALTHTVLFQPEQAIKKYLERIEINCTQVVFEHFSCTSLYYTILYKLSSTLCVYICFFYTFRV